MKPVNQEMNETATYNCFFEFLEKNKDRIFRFWVYKRIFTPLEQEKKYIDECVYEDTHAQTGIIREVVVLPDKDLLLGFYIPCCDTADEEDEYRHIVYYKLSEIRMEYRPVDMEEFYGGQEPE